MKKVMYKVYLGLTIIGVDLLKTVKFFKGLPFYCRDFRMLILQKGNNQDFIIGTLYPILGERFSESGTMSGHYFHQDLLVARKIYENNPLKHVDIGSSKDGFVAHVAVFREIIVFDI